MTTTKPLPKKLGKEPLIDVVCGVNFDSDIPANTLLPGLLMPKFSGKQPKFETLPVAQLPREIRESDPNLKGAALMRIVVDNQFAVLIGANWLGVGCQMPYAGWSSFSGMIQRVFNVLSDMPSVNAVNRLSIKYVDFVKNQGSVKSLPQFNVNIEIAGRKLTSNTTHLRTEISDPPYIHATTILSPATAKAPTGESFEGVLIDVDTHRVEKFSLHDFLTNLPVLIDEIHTANKKFFFELLSEEELMELEPVYD